MRPVRMLVLTMATAVVGMAFIGVGSAMAEEGEKLDIESAICKSDVLLCPKSSVLPAGSIITAVSLEGENAPVLLGAINEKCKKSTFKMQITSLEGMNKPLEGTGGLSFSECTPCTKVTASAGTVGLDMAGEPEPGDHHWISTTPISTTFEGCPFGVTCKFGGTVELLAHNDLALGGLLILAEEELLPLTGGNSKLFCGNQSFWDGHYVAAGHWLSSTELF